MITFSAVQRNSINLSSKTEVIQNEGKLNYIQFISNLLNDDLIDGMNIKQS